MPWKLKIDEESKAPVFSTPDKEGDLPKPIYLNEEGKEITLDPVGMYGKIIDMGKTEKELRGTTKRLEGQLELFADIEDISAWKEEADNAIQTVANFNDKDWMDVKKVDKLKEEMNTAHANQVQQLKDNFQSVEESHQAAVTKKDKQLRKLMVSSKFATHPLFSGNDPKTTLPPEIAETYFGKHFRVEENDQDELILTAYYDNGDPVYSHDNPGELAGFNEAMFSIFEKYPGKDGVLKTGGSGSGGTGGSGGGADDGDNELQRLKKEHAEAMDRKDAKLAIILKNKITALESAARRAA